MTPDSAGLIFPFIICNQTKTRCTARYVETSAIRGPETYIVTSKPNYSSLYEHGQAKYDTK